MMGNKSIMLMGKKVAGFVLSAALVFGLCVGLSVNASADATEINTEIRKTYDGTTGEGNADTSAGIAAAQAKLAEDYQEESDDPDDYQYVTGSLEYGTRDAGTGITVTMKFNMNGAEYTVESTGGIIEKRQLNNPMATFKAVLAEQGNPPVLKSIVFAADDIMSENGVEDDVKINGELSQLSAKFEYEPDTAGTSPLVKSEYSADLISLTGEDAKNYTATKWGDITITGGELAEPVKISVSPTSVMVKASAAKANAVLPPLATVTGGDPDNYELTTDNPLFVVGGDNKLWVGADALAIGTYEVSITVDDKISPVTTSEEITVIVEADSGTGLSGGGGTPAPTADEKVTGQINAGNKPAITLTTNGTLAALSGNTLNIIAANGGSLPINQGIYTMTLSPELIQSLNLSGTDKVDITIKKTTADGTDLSIGTDEANGSLLLFTADVTLSINGTEVKNFPYPITFSVDISSFDLTDEQKANLTGIRILLNGEIVQLGGYVDGDNFIFSTMQLSKYGVAISDNIIKIAAAINSTAYTINGEQMITDVAPMMIDDRTIMVPVRFIAEAFGADVSWADETKTVGIALDGKNLSMIIGQKTDGMDVAPTIIDGRTLVPLRYISEKLGANAIWDDATRSINITR